MRADWSKTAPAGTVLRKYIAREIRYAKEDIEDRFSRQYYMGTSQALDGKTKQLIFYAQGSDPTPESSSREGILYTKSIESYNELFYRQRDSSDNINTLQITRKGMFSIFGILGVDTTTRSLTSGGWTTETNLQPTFRVYSGEIYLVTLFVQASGTAYDLQLRLTDGTKYGTLVTDPTAGYVDLVCDFIFDASATEVKTFSMQYNRTQTSSVKNRVMSIVRIK